MYHGPYPSRRRTQAGFLIAPPLAALPLALLNLDGRLSSLLLAMLYAAVFAYAHALISSLPLFLWLRHRRVAPILMHCVLGGAGSAALPWLLATPFAGGLTIFVMIIAVPFGALGGGLFWLVACRGVPGLPTVAAEVE